MTTLTRKDYEQEYLRLYRERYSRELVGDFREWDLLKLLLKINELLVLLKCAPRTDAEIVKAVKEISPN